MSPFSWKFFYFFKISQNLSLFFGACQKSKKTIVSPLGQIGDSQG